MVPGNCTTLRPILTGATTISTTLPTLAIVTLGGARGLMVIMLWTCLLLTAMWAGRGFLMAITSGLRAILRSTTPLVPKSRLDFTVLPVKISIECTGWASDSTLPVSRPPPAKVSAYGLVDGAGTTSMATHTVLVLLECTAAMEAQIPVDFTPSLIWTTHQVHPGTPTNGPITPTVTPMSSPSPSPAWLATVKPTQVTYGYQQVCCGNRHISTTDTQVVDVATSLAAVATVVTILQLAITINVVLGAVVRDIAVAGPFRDGIITHLLPLKVRVTLRLLFLWLIQLELTCHRGTTRNRLNLFSIYIVSTLSWQIPWVLAILTTTPN